MAFRVIFLGHGVCAAIQVYTSEASINARAIKPGIDWYDC